MRQILLAFVLIAVPVALFSIFQIHVLPSKAQAASLGDLSGIKAIVGDVEAIAKTGDLARAKTRIIEFETAWDRAEATTRPLDESSWGHVDDAADLALRALRAQAPDAKAVETTLSGLVAALDDPAGAGAGDGAVKAVSGIAVSDASGHPLACEAMLKSLREAVAGGKIAKDKQAEANDDLTKAIERCNADDDVHADEFSAQGLALAGQNQ